MKAATECNQSRAPVALGPKLRAEAHDGSTLMPTASGKKIGRTRRGVLRFMKLLSSRMGFVSPPLTASKINLRRAS